MLMPYKTAANKGSCGTFSHYSLRLTFSSQFFLLETKEKAGKDSPLLPSKQYHCFTFRKTLSSKTMMANLGLLGTDRRRRDVSVCLPLTFLPELTTTPPPLPDNIGPPRRREGRQHGGNCARATVSRFLNRRAGTISRCPYSAHLLRNRRWGRDNS